MHNILGESEPGTDRKFKPRSTSAEYTQNPPSSSTPLCSPPQTINFTTKTAFVWCSRRFHTRNKRRMHTAYNPELAAHTTRRTTPAPSPHQSTRRRASHVSKFCGTTCCATLSSGCARSQPILMISDCCKDKIASLHHVRRYVKQPMESPFYINHPAGM